jgi:hypothetical protein
MDMGLETIPPRLFTSQVPTGGREFSCYVRLGQADSPAAPGDRLTWTLTAAGAEHPLLSGTHILTERDLTLGLVPVAAVLPFAWEGGRLHVTLQTAGATQEATHVIHAYEQQSHFRLPMHCPALILGGHRLGEVHRLAWQVYSQQFAWDLLPLASPVWSVFDAPLTDQPQASNFTGFGCDVVAPAPGTIVRAVGDQRDLSDVGELPAPEAFLNDLARALGNVVVIDHGAGVWSVLAHLRHHSVHLKAGQRVDAGQVVGRVGNSGFSSGPHLHLHFMDGPDPLTASPLPVALDAEGETYAPQAGELLLG